MKGYVLIIREPSAQNEYRNKTDQIVAFNYGSKLKNKVLQITHYILKDMHDCENAYEDSQPSVV